MNDAPRRPGRDESAEYYFTYIDQTPAGDIRDLLATQGLETVNFLRGISDQRSLHRYAPDKWSIRDVVAHVTDTERVFVYRALWFARGFSAPLPSFDQNVGVAGARADNRDWNDLVGEFSAVRDATARFFRSLAADAWDRRGIASDKPFTVRALAFITYGHVAHHNKVLHERYLATAQ